MKRAVLSCLVLGACGGHHDADPGSIPIAVVTTDAVYVVNGGDSSISVISTATHAVLGTILLEHVTHPHHIYQSADRSTLLVAVPSLDFSSGHHVTKGMLRPTTPPPEYSGAVLALEATTGALVNARRFDAPNHNAAFAPDGKIWTTQLGSPGEVLVLDPQTLETSLSAPVEDFPSEVTFSASGDHAFVANTGSDSVSIFDAATGAFVKTVTVGDAPVGAWPAPNGRMYVDNEAGKSLSVIDTTTLEVVATFDLGFTPALAALAPNGELWVTDTDAGKVVFLDAMTGAKLGELATDAGAHAIAFDDAGSAYITNQNADTVTVIDVALHGVVTEVRVGLKPNGIVFRAD